MKQKISLFIIALILVLPIALYAVFKAPQNAVAAEVKGKPVVLEFSSPLCSECQKLKKIMDPIEPKYKNKVVFQKINAAMIDNNAIAKIEEYNVKVVPTTVFIDKKGHSVARLEGSLEPQTIEYYLNEILK